MSEHIEINEIGSPSHNSEVFNRYYPDGELSTTTFDVLPSRVQTYFQNKGEQFTDQPFLPKKLFDIAHPNGDHTYATSHVKTLSTNGETDVCIYVGDVDGDGKFVGGGEVVINTSTHIGTSYYHKPFVGYTFTEEESRRKGFGKRRYVVMNALSQIEKGLPLHSSDATSEEAKEVWEQLVQEGKARKYQDAGKDRYVFNEITDKDSENNPS